MKLVNPTDFQQRSKILKNARKCGNNKTQIKTASVDQNSRASIQFCTINKI